MPIDWFTVGAQTLNFLILIWLMKRFLYQPILNAIDAREKRIADELAVADAKRAAAKKERDEFQHRNEQFDRQRATRLAEVASEAKAEHHRLLEEARQAANALSDQHREMLRQDAQNLHQAITRRTQCEVFAIARQALTDLAGVSLEKRMSTVFIRRLRALDGTAKTVLDQALRTASEPVFVRSTFDLPAEQQAAIQSALHETFSTDISLRFTTAPEIISGIEFSVNGQKMAWSIADYLESLERSVDELLETQTRPETKRR